MDAHNPLTDPPFANAGSMRFLHDMFYSTWIMSAYSQHDQNLSVEDPPKARNNRLAPTALNNFNQSWSHPKPFASHPQC
jgi:hypothetical protein